MIADVTAQGGCSHSAANKIRGEQIGSRAADVATSNHAAETPGATLAAEHGLFHLAQRTFAALLPEIEALSTEIE